MDYDTASLVKCINCLAHHLDSNIQMSSDYFANKQISQWKIIKKQILMIYINQYYSIYVPQILIDQYDTSTL